MSKKKLYITICSAAALAAAIAFFILGFHINTSSIASQTLTDKTDALKKDTENINSEIESISSEIEALEPFLSDKDNVNKYYVEYKDKNLELKTRLQDLKNMSSELDASIEAKQKEKTDSELENKTQGMSYKLRANRSYSCPQDIPPARYIAKGSGTIVVYTASKTARETENLDVAYDNSYTFNLADKESVRTTGSVTLTELK